MYVVTKLLNITCIFMFLYNILSIVGCITFTLYDELGK